MHSFYVIPQSTAMGNNERQLRRKTKPHGGAGCVFSVHALAVSLRTNLQHPVQALLIRFAAFAPCKGVHKFDRLDFSCRYFMVMVIDIFMATVLNIC